MTADPLKTARPITPWLLPALAWQTLSADRASYRSAGPRTLRDVTASVRPSLRSPVFVVGAPRSGTTFVGTCLARLPEVSYHFEPVATKAAAHYVYEGVWSEPRARRFYRSVYRWLLRIHAHGGRRFAEKTPRNCFTMDFLHRCFPDARFILILRDGRDAALSLRRKPWLRADTVSGQREPGGYAHGPHARFWVEPDRRTEFATTSDLHRCIWSWRRHTEVALRHATAMREDAVLIIRYERLVRDAATEGSRMLNFLGHTRSPGRDAFLERAREASPRSVGRWRSTFTDDDYGIIEREAGSLLHRLGYAGAGDGSRHAPVVPSDDAGAGASDGGAGRPQPR